MKHIAFAVVAAAALAIVGPRITPERWQIETFHATNAAATPHTSMVRMRAGEAPPSNFDRR